MSTKLIQKNLFKGTREYEIVGDQVHIRNKSFFKEETHCVMLAVLEPEPVISQSNLEFVSRVNGETLLSLALPRFKVSEFNHFINTVKKKANTEFSAISGIKVIPESDTLNGNSYDEPPEFDEISLATVSKDKTIKIEEVENAIRMLQMYIDNEEIQPLITALEALKNAPKNHENLVELASVFSELGSNQGAVLTYAPYISFMLSEDPFD